MKDTTIIVPTFCEAENLPELVKRIKASLDADILVVDDSSPDGTALVAEKLGCRVLVRRNKTGLASAVVDGIELSNSSRIAVIDADLQHPPEILCSLLRCLDSCELAVASRRVKGGSTKGLTLVRKLISFVANMLALPLAPRVKDRMSGCFAFRREILDGAKLDPTGYKVGLEIMAKGSYTSVAEVPYTFEARHTGASKMHTAQLIDYPAQLLKLVFGKHELLRFAVVGASGTFVKLGGTLLFTELFGLHYMISYGIAFVLSVLNNYLWNSIWTFKDRRAGLPGLGRYFLVSSFTLSINEALLYLLTEVAGLWYMFGATMGVLAAFIINYTVSRRFVWRS